MRMRMRGVVAAAAMATVVSACGIDQPTPLVQTLSTGKYLWIDPQGNVVKIVSVVGSERGVVHATYRAVAAAPAASIDTAARGESIVVVIGGCAPVTLLIGDDMATRAAGDCAALPHEAMTLLDADPEQPSIDVSEY